ncbi:hypothetical protein [Halomonas alkalisoli]|uniref:hypothetical protein n=1 Tax=Halomonas alkalisoli TaxID=2907158 RepID=UPI001F1623BA|nr:hypothetical protein [Halomonas alkalisoli]MCE9683424.1 hypothetical protein [Halomonas alkalisoli]
MLLTLAMIVAGESQIDWDHCRSVDENRRVRSREERNLDLHQCDQWRSYHTECIGTLLSETIMSLYGLHRSLFARWSGMLIVWLLAWSVGVVFACSPPLEVNAQSSQVTVAAAYETAVVDAQSCDGHAPGVTASLGKVPADDLRSLTAVAWLHLDLLSSPLLPASQGKPSRLFGLSSYSSPPVYLATARLRI